MPHPAPPPPVSPELQAWLDRRDSLLEMKFNFEREGGHMSLVDEAIDPGLLPEPMRSEAYEYLCQPKKD